MPRRLARRVALIGWDAASWNEIHPLLDRGLLPNLQSVVERGVIGRIASSEPAEAALCWTTAATGHTADRHGILGPVAPDPVLGRLAPVRSDARRVRALWNILSGRGLRSIVAGWPSTYPAEEIAGAVVSDRFRTVTGIAGGPWPVAPRSVHPASIEAELAELRVSPADLTGDDLLPFLPRLSGIDQDRDRRPLALATALAENITTHAAATWLMERETWDLLAVRYDLGARVRAVFPGDETARNAALRFQDMMLGRLLQLAGTDAAVFLVSPFAADGGRGIVAVAGPGIRRDELVYGAALTDIAPSILAILGLPAGADMRGRAPAEAFEEPVERATVPTWEDGEQGDDRDATAADDAIGALAALGYAEPRDPDTEREIAAARARDAFTLARVHLAAGRPADAIPLLRDVIVKRPDFAEAALLLAEASVETGAADESRALLEPLLRGGVESEYAHLIRANVALAERDPHAAFEHLRAAEDCDPPAWVRALIGRGYLRLGRAADAVGAFQAAISTDGESAAARSGLAEALLARGAYEEAAAAALDAIALQFDRPEAHYTLGVALARLGNRERAAEALRACLALAPGMRPARAALAALS